MMMWPFGTDVVQWAINTTLIGCARLLYGLKFPPMTEIWPVHLMPNNGQSNLSAEEVVGPGLIDFSETAIGGAFALLAGKVTICLVGFAAVGGLELLATGAPGVATATTHAAPHDTLVTVPRVPDGSSNRSFEVTLIVPAMVVPTFNPVVGTKTLRTSVPPAGTFARLHRSVFPACGVQLGMSVSTNPSGVVPFAAAVRVAVTPVSDALYGLLIATLHTASCAAVTVVDTGGLTAGRTVGTLPENVAPRTFIVNASPSSS